MVWGQPTGNPGGGLALCPGIRGWKVATQGGEETYSAPKSLGWSSLGHLHGLHRSSRAEDEGEAPSDEAEAGYYPQKDQPQKVV